MDFTFTAEQSMLRDTLSGYLADQYSFASRRKAVASAAGWQPAVWQAFAEELGLLGAAFAEEHGGLGGGAMENAIIMEEFGKALVIEPYLDTVVIGGGFLKYGGNPLATALIGDIIAGKAVFAFAYAEPQGRFNFANLKTTATKHGTGWILNGRKAVVVGAPWATHLMVTARTGGTQCDPRGVSVFVVDKKDAGLSCTDHRTIDGSRAAEIRLNNVHLPQEALIGPEGAALPLIEKVTDEALASIAAEACGVMHKLYEDTLQYTKQRQQFGQPIANFQVLQHRMVDMYIQLQQSISMAYMATSRLDADEVTRAKAVSAAKVQIGKACRFVGQNAIQLHGGIGVTDELAVGHYFKRATVIESMLGSVDHHLTRYEVLSFGRVG
jgi:hypothetical protein